MAKKSNPVHFPGESLRYRAARNRLLAAERQLRKQVERVARIRRKLPLGGGLAEDYVFEEAADGLDGSLRVRPVKFSELFRDSQNTLVLYNFMFGPEMKHACPMCTSFLDSLDGEAPHITERASLAVAAKSGIQRIREFARSRGWRNLRLLSSEKNTYNRDYYGETAERGQMPSLNVFVRRGNKIYHFYNTELLFHAAERGQNERHIDMLWPLWNVLDLTPEGRGADWYPRLSYS